MSSWTGLTLLDRYRVGPLVGRGGMGVVYVADDLRRPGWKVAVKHPLKADDGTPGAVPGAELTRRFHGEVGKLIALGEIPGIVRIEDQGEHEGTPFYVMRFLPKGSLLDRLAHGPQAADAVVAWALPLAQALDRLHARTPALVHRDVKPQNVLFDDYDQPHLADFGIVKEVSAAWATTGAVANTGLGTPTYMAPEQMLPDGEVDGRTDQYALAATLYHALTGVPPRYETTAGAARREGSGGAGGTGGRGAHRKRLKPVHELAAHLSTAASAAIEKGLAKDQEDRFDTCTQLAQAFAAGLASTSTSATAPREGTRKVSAADGAAPVAARPSSSRRVAVLALVLAALAAGAWAGVNALTGKAQPSVSTPPPAPEPGPRASPAAKDESAPVVRVTEPLESPTVTTAAKVTLRGSVDDLGGALADVRLTDGAATIALDAAGAFAYEVSLAVDEEQTLSLRATDGAGNASKPVEVRVRREATWAAALRQAQAGRIAEDGESIRAALARPEAAEIPYARLKEAAEFLKAWDAEPSLTVLSNTPVEGTSKAGDVQARRLIGSFSSGRKADRVFVDGADATASPTAFQAIVTRAAAGNADVPYEIRSGTTVRKRGTIPVTFDAPAAPPTSEPPWAAWLVSPEQRAEAQRLGRPVAFEEPTTGMRFVIIPGGTFTMGSPDGEESHELDEGPQHEVTLTAYYLGVYEVTKAEYRKFKPDHDSGTGFNEDRQPVVVSHGDATAFLAWLSEQERVKGYRLPSEAQWERACRAGTTTPFSFGETISTEQANYDGDFTYGKGQKGVSRRGFVAVGSLPPNRWGLHEMHGNVWEWCSDRYGEYSNQAQSDPEGGTEGNARVLRGGSWVFNPRFLRSACRFVGGPADHFVFFGFRVALPVSAL